MFFDYISGVLSLSDFGVFLLLVYGLSMLFWGGVLGICIYYIYDHEKHK